MYLPVLRGKQYELLALREFSKEIRGSDIIAPVIEPVKSEFKTLETACNFLAKEDVCFTIIINPSVGEIKNPEHILRQINNTKCLRDNPRFQIGIHSYNESQLEFILGLIKEYGLENQELIIIHNDTISEDFYRAVSGAYKVKFNFLHEKIKVRRYKYLFPSETRVLLDDVFESKPKNSDYIGFEDEPFSDIYLIYKEENYFGFSDYLTIGEQYTDGGFLPYAVVIHLTYESRDGLRIKHFVSDSNDDYHDTPGKFAEALGKLVSFTATLPFKTKAIKTFEEYYNSSHYPGLGSIKKLSMLNHLELVNYLLTK
ncbi:sce7725 family protein [Chitinophagaceae bacterium LB-8]|uniref:Sce7725 family protein n=1 Tax=Paraflavisolibacter caeni TaxID=2982496 RepID=A0A9X2Y0Q4_9BACT|nr:sce7725 family protein [Paraflavisolibacter caeni]MCU7550968.1 sce7725 family protein [Paraflavisolibacter caeni]